MKVSLLLLLVAFLAAALSQDTPPDCSVVLCPANTVCKAVALDCAGGLCPQVACVAAPNVIDPCAEASCAQGSVCLPEPKQCITTPCPQFRCLPMEEFVCATSICTESTRCVASPKQCFTTPCPQYDCQPLTDSTPSEDECSSISCTASQICVAEPKQCFTTPCPQYACLSKTECPDFCPEVYQPVCGSNQKTYPNICKLRAAMCLTKASIYVQHDGECTVEEECTTICPMNYAPVCGSDGVTYGNPCALSAASCKAKTTISVAHEGECADCNIACPMNYAPVCGSDDRTYSNLCALKVAACKAKSSTLAVKYNGECEVAEEACPQFCPMNFAPVCGSDGTTYGNLCGMQAAACRAKTTITLLHDGECTAEDSPCNAFCTEQYEPLCGSDHQTYANKCFFESAKCRAKSSSFILHSGECLKTLWESVATMDTNGDGSVSFKEFADAHPEMSSADQTATFANSDNNKDGSLTAADFSASNDSAAPSGNNHAAVVVGVLAAFIGGIALVIAGYMYFKSQRQQRRQENLATSRNVGSNNFSKEYEAFDDSL